MGVVGPKTYEDRGVILVATDIRSGAVDDTDA